ncbi:UNVERIFIED_CONTAM: hypothetical protein GTU68_047224 [Idotea baltica]|nr:hypothetical protein [Idotea baltica]
MINLLYAEQAVGAAATMVGILKRVVVIDLQEKGKRAPISMINPEIIYRSEDLQVFEEGSICFPGVSAEIKRPTSITVNFLDEKGADRSLDASGYLSSVIQHEIDYLNGVTYFDYLTSVKKNLLLKKTKKHQRSKRV